jgi:hypothetical protein
MRTRLSDSAFYLFGQLLVADPGGAENLGGDAFALVEQSEQEVLGPDEVVLENPGALLGQDQDPPGAIGETLEHVSSSSRTATTAALRSPRPSA